MAEMSGQCQLQNPEEGCCNRSIPDLLGGLLDRTRRLAGSLIWLFLVQRSNQTATQWDFQQLLKTDKCPIGLQVCMIGPAL